MKNNGSFKILGTNIISEHQAGIKIYLESTDDEFIIGRKWFSQLKDKISFESDTETKGNGGCQLVLKKVQETNEATNSAFGIVDRDILLADPNFKDSLWWEIDNEVFTSAQPYGKNVFILHYWELENYLLHPNALSSLVRDKKLTLSDSIAASAIADLLIQYEEELVAVTLLSTVGATKNLNQPSVRFGIESEGSKLIEKINNHLSITETEFLNEKAKIIQFAEEESNSIDRWNNLSRMLDGKRIMYRIDKFLNKNKFKISLEDERGILAGYIAVNPLLENWLMDIYKAAPS